MDMPRIIVSVCYGLVMGAVYWFCYIIGDMFFGYDTPVVNTIKMAIANFSGAALTFYVFYPLSCYKKV